VSWKTFREHYKKSDFPVGLRKFGLKPFHPILPFGCQAAGAGKGR
jgi:hypothetical protein